MTNDEYQRLYEDIKAYHKALDDLLALFVAFNGYDNILVDEALKALSLHPELPVTMAFSERVRGNP